MRRDLVFGSSWEHTHLLLVRICHTFVSSPHAELFCNEDQQRQAGLLTTWEGPHHCTCANNDTLFLIIFFDEKEPFLLPPLLHAGYQARVWQYQDENIQPPFKKKLKINNIIGWVMGEERRRSEEIEKITARPGLWDQSEDELEEVSLVLSFEALAGFSKYKKQGKAYKVSKEKRRACAKAQRSARKSHIWNNKDTQPSWSIRMHRLNN